MANFRPVSNLTFLSKVVEKAVAQQLTKHLSTHSLLPCHQSAYRRHQSTETAMLRTVRVLSDALTVADGRRVTLLGLLDMSAAFDCVDHDLLLQRLEKNFGLTGVVLRWMTSFLCDRTLEVRYNGASTAAQPVYYGVPQSLVLRPILFNLYTADITLVAARHGLQLHQYTDDCQLYVSAPVDEASATVSGLSHCVTDVASWLSASRLRLNPAKTVLMWLGSRQQVEKIGIREVPIHLSVITTVD